MVPKECLEFHLKNNSNFYDMNYFILCKNPLIRNHHQMAPLSIIIIIMAPFLLQPRAKILLFVMDSIGTLSFF